MKLQEVMRELEALGSENQRKFNTWHCANDHQFGCKMGDIRVVAKKITLLSQSN